MNIGPDKGPLVAEMASRLPLAARVLEVGAYCGYSSIMLADALGSEAAGHLHRDQRDVRRKRTGNR